MSILDDMSIDDLNMYYSGTMLSIQGRIGRKPFRCDSFGMDDNDEPYAHGIVLSKTRKGEYERKATNISITSLLTEIPTLGYITTAERVEWIEVRPSNRGYKKGFNMDNITPNLGREGLWNIYNEEYRDFIIAESRVIYKEIDVGAFVDKKFIPSHSDFDYLEEYINEEINRVALW